MTRLFSWRRRPKRDFDPSPGAEVDDEVYDGPATIRIRGEELAVRVRLTGHIEPIDGRYHWQGMVFGELPDDVLKGPPGVTVAIGERTAAARITERTPWGSHTIAGVGDPPFPLDDVEIAVPIR